MRPANVFCVSVLMLSVSNSFTGAAEPVNPAHALAEKFAQQEKPKPAPKPPVPPAFKVAPKPGADYEQEMLDSARAEADAQRIAGNPAPVAPASAAPAPVATPAASTPAATAPAVAQAPASAATPPVTPPPAEAPKPPAVTAAPGVGVSGVDAGPVTILLVLAASPTTGDKVQSNPIVCVGEQCYISDGAANAAKIMPKAEAMAAKDSALGLPGACQGTTSCVFRDVAMPAGQSLQVVDAGFARAAPFAAIDVHPDPTCAIQDDDLDCEQTVSAKDYRLWVIPEQVAKLAKPVQIEDALSTGLIEENITRADDK